MLRAAMGVKRFRRARRFNWRTSFEREAVANPPHDTLEAE
jgi:hypothetical protein